MVDKLCLVLGLSDHDRRMTGRRVRPRPVARVDHAVYRGDHRPGLEYLDHSVELLQHSGRVRFGQRQGTETESSGGHVRDRVEPMSGNITNGDAELSVRERDDRIPVAADDAGLGGAVTYCNAHARNGRKNDWKERTLQRLHEMTLLGQR